LPAAEDEGGAAPLQALLVLAKEKNRLYRALYGQLFELEEGTAAQARSLARALTDEVGQRLSHATIQG